MAVLANNQQSQPAVAESIVSPNVDHCVGEDCGQILIPVPEPLSMIKPAILSGKATVRTNAVRAPIE